MRHRRREPAPRPTDPNCPTWCTTDHPLDIDLEDGTRLHARHVARAVEVVAVDDLEEGTRTAAEVVVQNTSCSSKAQTRRLALAILEAADYLAEDAR